MASCWETSSDQEEGFGQQGTHHTLATHLLDWECACAGYFTGADVCERACLGTYKLTGDAVVMNQAYNCDWVFFFVMLNKINGIQTFDYIL